MTTKHLSGYYADGYTLSAQYSKLVIEKSAEVSGSGIETTYLAKVVNQGSVEGSHTGVYMRGGGSLTNGSTKDTSASIDGYFGVKSLGPLAVNNFGTIEGSGPYGAGVDLEAGGSLTNGSGRGSSALISGYCGVRARGAPASIVNFGMIEGNQFGVALYDGGTLTNGSTADTSAFIAGVRVWSTGVTVTNFGRIANYFGCEIGGLSTLNNEGTIQGIKAGVSLSGGGAFLANGSADNPKAFITGQVGLYAGDSDPAQIANFGTFQGALVGIDLRYARLTLDNGSNADRKALITGGIGVYAYDSSEYGAVTATNFGTIEGTRGVAVELIGAQNELIAEAGSTFIGSIEGGGGKLALAGGGAGTISGLGGAGTLTGAVAADFSGFASYEIGAGGVWVMAGPSTLNADSSLVDDGTLVNRGALTIGGTLTVGTSALLRLSSGDVMAGPSGAASLVDHGLVVKNTGAGTVTVGAQLTDDGVAEVAVGTLDFTSHLLGTGVLRIDGGATLEADAAAVSTLSVAFNGPAATLALKLPTAFHASLGGLIAGDAIDLLAITATGASVNGGDQLVVVNGAKTVATLQMTGDYVGATFAAASDGHGGTAITLTSGPPAAATHGFVAAMAGIGAGVGADHVPVFGGENGRPPMLAAPRIAAA